MIKTSKKIIGGLMICILAGTIGAVIVSAHPNFFSELTDEQKEEIKELRQSLIEEEATCEEIREAIESQIEEYGIEIPTREEILDEQIEHAKQKLNILERKKELIQENPDITNEEIQEIIQNEFELEIPEFANGNCHNMRHHRGFHPGPFCGPCEDLGED